MTATRAGPKPAASRRPLPVVPGAGAEHVASWCERFIICPKGRGARSPLSIRPWQRNMLSIFDDPRPTIALWSLPRGSGKTTLAAAIALHQLHADGEEGARVVLLAADERQASLALSVASRATELHEGLAKRTLIYRDRLIVPRTDSQLIVLPGEHHRLEGLDISFALVDEIGVVDRRCWETVLHGLGKRERSMALAIGTPSPPSHIDSSPMSDLVAYGRDHADDPTFHLTEYGASPTDAIDDEEVWTRVCPGLDDLTTREHMRSLLPPKTRPAEYARARLGVWVDQVSDPWLPVGAWSSCAAPGPVPDGADVVIALDGSFSMDATVVSVASVSPSPHLDIVDLWEPPPNDDGSYRIPVVEVEDCIRAAARRWNVVEIIADPFRWNRSLQVLADEGLPVVEFPQTPSRMTPATTGLYEAVVNGQVTHSGDDRLARHVANAMTKSDARGTRLSKDRRNSSRRIDAAVTSVMAHSRAVHHARAKRGRRVYAFN